MEPRQIAQPKPKPKSRIIAQHILQTEMRDVKNEETGEMEKKERLMFYPHTFQRTKPKVGRNEPCHCNSGLKFKRCHGRAS